VNETLSAPSPLCEADIPIESSTSVALPGRDAGFLQMRVVPDDNSCLFSALGVVFEGGVEGGKGLRKGKSFMGWIIGQRLPSGLVVAGAIRDDPATYSEVVLG
jgi:ubiquitin thioesterase OTU1